MLDLREDALKVRGARGASTARMVSSLTKIVLPSPSFKGAGKGTVVPFSMSGDLEETFALDKFQPQQPSPSTAGEDIGRPAKDSDADSGVPPDALRNLRVLVIDESRSSRRALSQVLKLRFGRVTEALDALEAIAQLRLIHEEAQPHIDIIFIDCDASDDEAMNTSKSLRDFGFDGVIVGVTSRSTSGENHWAVKYGCSKMLSKPVDSKTIDGLVEGKLVRRQI